MRIISGEFRGFKLDTPKGDAIRPTTDRIKEDVFNIISPYIEDSLFLDLFSGTGAIGIEAISRGCAKAVLVDHDKTSIALIKKNASKIKSRKIEIICSNAEKFLLSTQDKYDIIFMDPPYRYENIGKLIDIIEKRDIINNNGIMIIEQGGDSEIEEKIGYFILYKTKKYASTKMYYFKHDGG